MQAEFISKHREDVHIQNFIIPVAALLLLAFALYYYSTLIRRSDTETVETGPPTPTEDELVAQQMREIEELRRAAGATPPTEEEIKDQMQEITAARKASGATKQTESDINRQMKEVEALRNGAAQ